MRCGRSGFTLIEILLVAVMLSAVALAVHKAFSDGISLWRRVNLEVPEEDLSIFFSDIEMKLAGTFGHAGIRFEGEGDRIAFPGIVALASEEEAPGTVGRVAYFLDGGNDSVCREETNYSQVHLGKPGTVRCFLKKAESLRFYYYCRDPVENRLLWVEEWSEDETPTNVDVSKAYPVAVRIEVRLREGDEYKKYTKTVAVPVGG